MRPNDRPNLELLGFFRLRCSVMILVVMAYGCCTFAQADDRVDGVGDSRGSGIGVGDDRRGLAQPRYPLDDFFRTRIHQSDWSLPARLDPQAEPSNGVASMDSEVQAMPAVQPNRLPVVRQAAAEGELIPLVVPNAPANVELSTNDELVNLVASGAALDGVLRMIAEHHGMNLVIGSDVAGPITVSIKGVRLEEVLDAICGVSGFKWHRVGNLLYVTGASAEGISPIVQGRYLRVYTLDYLASSDIESIVNGLLSTVGNAYVNEAASDDHLKTRETLIVEDVLAAHTRVEQFLAQADVPPKQVLVEAHVLQIALSDEDRHGINLEAIARTGNSRITLTGGGFADDDASGPSVALRVDGRDMDSLIEMVQRNTNSRTLASPKLSVVNHQEARIQIGQRLPYSVSTTTQTTTVQNVQFLEVGVVLTVRPVITDDGNVLMTVLPKVSGGQIGDSGFPEEETTEVSTTVLMPDGGGIVIGGLIRDVSSNNRAMIPYVGRVPLLGNLFKRKSQESRRNELVVALVTRVMHDHLPPRQKEVEDLDDALPVYAKEGMLETSQLGFIHSQTTDPIHAPISHPNAVSLPASQPVPRLFSPSTDLPAANVPATNVPAAELP